MLGIFPKLVRKLRRSPSKAQSPQPVVLMRASGAEMARLLLKHPKSAYLNERTRERYQAIADGKLSSRIENDAMRRALVPPGSALWVVAEVEMQGNAEVKERRYEWPRT